ncbi:MAG: hypothetical protein EBU90_27005 [Proteobacteria bacterium]|nr:hypothetical protein [Pseudomonadota bacterium]
MKKPTFDSEGYPSEETLNYLERFLVINKGRCESDNLFVEMFDFFFDAYDCHYGKIEKHDGYYRVVTGGWSGNESLIGALERSGIWSYLCLAYVQGGCYYLRDPRTIGKRFKFNVDVNVTAEEY